MLDLDHSHFETENVPIDNAASHAASPSATLPHYSFPIPGDLNRSETLSQWSSKLTFLNLAFLSALPFARGSLLLQVPPRLRLTRKTLLLYQAHPVHF